MNTAGSRAATARPQAADGRSWVSILSELTKARITFFVTVSVIAGYALFAGTLDTGALLPMLGVFLLACGSAALNQVQESKLDAKMNRTMNRPIPSGVLRRDWALFIAMALSGAGLYVLASIPNHTLSVLGLGLLALVWYNGVYLGLKRVTAFAVVPGALVGAIPPVIGWCAAGGVWNDPRILEVGFFFFLWQIPHFWLLLLLYGKEYEGAGLPSPTSFFTPGQLRRITFVWTLAVAATGLVLAVRLRFPLPWNLVALALAIWLALSGVAILRWSDERKSVIASFLRINVYALAMMFLLAIQAIL